MREEDRHDTEEIKLHFDSWEDKDHLPVYILHFILLDRSKFFKSWDCVTWLVHVVRSWGKSYNGGDWEGM